MGKEMDLSREKQYDRLAKARRWAKTGNIPMCAKMVKEAARFRPISSMQFWYLKIAMKPYELNDMLRRINMDPYVG
jgi:hypothetical protein